MIVATYSCAENQWTVCVGAFGQRFTTQAADILEARRMVDQFLREHRPKNWDRPVLHLLDGCPVAFTERYIQARFRSEPGVSEQSC